VARIGISITKSFPFRNGTQEFSNVYYYDSIGNLPDQAEAAALIDEVTAFEKPWHTTGATFVRGRCWSAGGSPGSNEMIDQHNLSGTGAIGSMTTMDKERAYLFRIRAGNDSRGNPVYLRKWYHCNGVFPGATSVSDAILQNTSGFSAGQRAGMEATMNTAGAVGGGAEEWKLCSKNGRFPDAGAAWSAHQFLEHHQLGDMWRAQ
jgi:hypothetical protein